MRRVGDLVVHAEHGVARLRRLASVGAEERVALDYAEGADLLIEPWDLAQALAARRGAVPPPPPAAIHGLPEGRFPQAWIPEENLRLALLCRCLARLREPDAVGEFEAELTDRFGDLPPEAAALLEHARVRLISGSHGISKLEIGPKGLVFTFRNENETSLARIAASMNAKVVNGRVILGLIEQPLIRVLEEYLPI